MAKLKFNFHEQKQMLDINPTIGYQRHSRMYMSEFDSLEQFADEVYSALDLLESIKGQNTMTPDVALISPRKEVSLIVDADVSFPNIAAAEAIAFYRKRGYIVREATKDDREQGLVETV